MKTIPSNEREQIKKIYAERGEIIRKKRPTGNALLKLKYQWYMQDYLACVASIDENVGKVLNYLDSTGLAANTLVMYTSDQGFYLGQNGWFDKRWMYDVSMKTPLLIRWPGKIAPGTICDQLTQNIDHAPTLLEVAGIPAPKDMHGINLLPLLTNPQYELPRKSVYYHFYEFKGAHTVLQHIGVRTARYKLIHFYTVNEWQLYDVLNDPEEQKNLYNIPAFESIQKSLQKELIALQKQYDDTNPAAPLK
jgi:arylsulfatase A-like enzyme